MRSFFVLLGIILLVAVGGSGHAEAASLKVMPLKYDIALKSGESKKGFIDFANTDVSAATVRFSVQAFRQINDKGDLEFYNDAVVSSAVRLDYEEVDIGPRENLHLAYAVNSTALPKGDSFAAVFATVVPKESGAATQTIRVGSLLFITNDTPSPREAEIDHVTTPWFQVGESLSVQFTVRNPAEKANTGYAPDVTVRLQPYTEKTVHAPFVMAGRSRDVTYIQKGNFLGPLVVNITTNTSTKSQLIFAVTGYWRWLFPLLIAALSLGVYGFIRYRKKRVVFHVE